MIPTPLRPALLATLLAFLAACAGRPQDGVTGPTVAAVASPYKPLDVFMADDTHCRERAAAATGPLPQDTADASMRRLAVAAAQRRYDQVYRPCMVARGNAVPGAPTPRAELPPARP